MPLFAINAKKKLEAVQQSSFSIERELQQLVESSLESVFQCRFVASELPTNFQRGGRMYTLGLSEAGNPVIIEFKRSDSSKLVTQNNHYRAWIHDHCADIEGAVRKALGSHVDVNWDDVRLICLAPSYKKFDLYAMQAGSVELWSYRLFANQTLYLEKLQQNLSFSASIERIASHKHSSRAGTGKKLH